MFFQYKMESYLRDIFKNEFSSYFSDISNDHIYTVDEFVDKLKNNGFFNLIPYEFEEDQVIITIMEIVEKYADIINYKNIVRSNDEYFYTSELAYLRYNNYCPIGLKRNNFVNFICDGTIEPWHNFRNLNSVSQTKKQDLWKLFYENNYSKCLICNTNNLTQKSFDIGYIETPENGGTASLDNLFPICPNCNRLKGKDNWYDFDNDSYDEIVKIKSNLDDKTRRKYKIANYMNIE